MAHHFAQLINFVFQYGSNYRYLHHLSVIHHATCATPHAVIPSSFVQSLAGISLQVLNLDGNACFPVATSIAFINNGNSLSIDCSNFNAYTDSSWGIFSKTGAANWSFKLLNHTIVHFTSTISNSMKISLLGVSSAIDAFSFFGPWLSNNSKIVCYTMESESVSCTNISSGC